MPLALINIVVILGVVGLVLWALSQIPMDPVISKIIRVIVIVFSRCDIRSRITLMGAAERLKER